MRFVLLFVLCLVLGARAAAQTTPAPSETARSLVIPRVAEPPSIEDYLDGTPRGDEVAVTDFVQREPGDGVPASQRTEAYLSYDDDHLYVVFVARDDQPGQVRASLTKREAFENDDFVGVMLDTFRDRRRAYLFLVNPRGVQRDGVSTDGDNDDDYSYDTIWQSEGHLTPFGYVVRIAIPFKSLRFSTASRQEWGLALTRGIPRNNETSFWPYITRRVAGFGQQLASATGLREISPGRNLQVIPYAAFTRARFLDDPRPRYVSDADGRAGIDGKVVVKDAFTVDLTLNPDFSQVESDEPQVTINQRFEVFFPEKRPFFIENASYFATPIDLFFSRRIGDPRAGVRVTGKTGGWALAGLAMDDRAPGDAVGPRDPAFGSTTGIGVVRVQRDLPRQSSIGVLATARDFATTESRVISLDGRWKMSDTWTLTGQAALSDYQESAASVSGPAFSLELDRTGRSWGTFVQYEDFSPGFRAPLGFVTRVDMRQIRPFVRYTWFPERAGIVSLRPEISGRALWNHAGTLEDWEFGSEFQVEMKRQTEFEVDYNESMERFQGIEFRKRAGAVRFETAWFKAVEASARLERGQEINYFPANGLPPFLADATSAELSLTLKPVSQLQIDQTYLFTRLDGREEETAGRSDAVLVDNHIWRTRASYQFTRRFSLRTIFDYSTVRPDESLIDLEREKQFAADVLFTYQINPWTAAYVGYTDGYGNLAVDPLDRDRLRRTDATLHSLGRQVFTKLSYLFRF